MMRKLGLSLLFVLLSLGVASAQASLPSAHGIWLGTLSAGSASLRLQFRLDPVTGACSLDSLDQGEPGIGCTDLQNTGADVSFTAPMIHASFRGKLSADSRTLSGTWSQGKEMPITLTRQN